MADRLSIREFIIALLEEADCRGVHELGIKSNINSQCPYHRPKKNTSAFGISYIKEEEGYPFQCFSCGRVGTIIHLIMHLKDCDYKNAEKLFFDRIILPVINIETLKKKLKKLDNELKIEEEEKDVMVELPKRGDRHELVRYFKERNEEQHHKLLLTKNVIKTYNLSYCDEGYYARRIIMPIRNLHGQNIYFTNRAVDDGVKKTLHIRGMNVEKFVYGLYEAHRALKVIIVEGPFDLFQIVSGIWRMGVKDLGVVAILGTLMTEERASIIGETFEEAYTLFDEGEAGWGGESTAIDLLNDYMKVRSLRGILNRGKDPGTANKMHLRRIFDRIARNTTIQEAYNRV